MKIPKPYNKKDEREKRINNAREDYRIRLLKARKESGCNIPFGANLDLFTNVKK